MALKGLKFGNLRWYYFTLWNIDQHSYQNPSEKNGFLANTNCKVL